MPCPKCLLLFHRFFHKLLAILIRVLVHLNHTRATHTLGVTTALHPSPKELVLIYIHTTWTINHSAKMGFFSIFSRGWEKEMDCPTALLTEKFFIKVLVSSQPLLRRGCAEPSRWAVPDAGTKPFPKRGKAGAPALAAGTNSTDNRGPGCSHGIQKRRRLPHASGQTSALMVSPAHRQHFPPPLEAMLKQPCHNTGCAGRSRELPYPYFPRQRVPYELPFETTACRPVPKDSLLLINKTGNYRHRMSEQRAGAHERLITSRTVKNEKS